ncbi:NADH-quinone oxidoreductase subunit NuoG [Fundidesulfovibrio terrae]|uniref:NADH-quinone oxidoreductase subunit NuoG n=1 Tax=Fundidesulfovibrio terrae TaxID=2922866 RepID=UPI001FAEC52B|nr:NADH-quinone oxidoreductase subunit NuoG [Fundidesulfovibrio terrae]
MPDLIIDGLSVSVPEGTTVLEAAEQVGIMIPRFCFHPALGPAGSCRMCAVMFTDGPVKGLQMSCMVTAKNRMVVDTGHPEALEFRRHIAELLMLHHPHDCPVCDEGGHCLLQDTTISCGHGIREFKGKKRTYRNQELGPLVIQEMNRCIHCYRCARYYQEFAGGRDFGPVRIAGDVAYGRYAEGPLESPFAGNLVEVCPTGVFTDKPSRHKARHWDLERSPSVCLSCSLGCNTTASARYRSIIKIEARHNPEVNGHFLCDRGRHGYEYANLADRPRSAQVDGQDVSMQAAMSEAAKRLKAIVAEHGPGSVACLGSARQSLESQAALKMLAQKAGWTAPEFTSGSHRKLNMLAAVAGLGRDLHVSMNAIPTSDCILVVGAGPLSEAPMLALAIRQAARKGAAVAVIDPRPVEMPLDFTHFPARRHDMEAALGAILRRAFPEATPEDAGFLAALSPDMPENAAPPGWEEFAARLAESAFPVIVCGSDIVRLSTPALAAAGAKLLAKRRGRAGFFPVLAGANAHGAALMNPDTATSFDDVLAGIDDGRIKALICMESDPVARFADHARIQAAIHKIDLLLCVDFLPSATRWQSHVFLPCETVFESGGSFINQEGRVQYASPAFAGGTPMALTLKNGHPPRTYAKGVPGSQPLPGWDLLAGLADALGCSFDAGFHPWRAVADASPALAGLAPERWPHDGALVLPDVAPGASLDARPSPIPPDLAADLIITEQAFGTEELSSYGTILKSLAPTPQVVLHTLDANTIELREEDFVLLSCGTGPVNCYLRMVDNMARSTVVLPRRHDSGWRHAVASGYTVQLELLRKHPAGPEEELP